jgi:hypothetical protein
MLEKWKEICAARDSEEGRTGGDHAADGKGEVEEYPFIKCIYLLSCH